MFVGTIVFTTFISGVSVDWAPVIALSTRACASLLYCARRFWLTSGSTRSPGRIVLASTSPIRTLIAEMTNV
jgi:hypothetical protein